MLPRYDVSRPSLLLLAALPLTACGGSLPHPPYVPQATSTLAPVEFAPPPGRAEAIPPRPPAADAWVDGEWIYRHGRWFWLLGRWVKTPPGARYAPWVCVHAIDGAAYYAPSAWYGANGAPLEPGPPPLALATASGEAVFDAEGDVEETGRSLKTAPAVRRRPDEQPAP
jgi:hypothetical protein